MTKKGVMENMRVSSSYKADHSIWISSHFYYIQFFLQATFLPSPPPPQFVNFYVFLLMNSRGIQFVLLLWLYFLFRMITGFLFCTGGEAYVVIDKRSTGEPDLQGSSSDDGNITLLSSMLSVCILK